MLALSLSDLLPVLQTAIGPVILISGIGLLLLNMTNRYGRIIDRSRDLLRRLGPEADRKLRRPERLPRRHPQARRRVDGRHRRWHPGAAARDPRLGAAGRRHRADLRPVGFVRAAVGAVRGEILLVGGLVAFVVLLFLGSWRATLVVLTSIPLALLSSVLGLSLAGATFTRTRRSACCLRNAAAATFSTTSTASAAPPAQRRPRSHPS
ncbi:MAG: DUF2721 domain-containing protein [Planctomycetes bacterium]|nr:DUF2721 domain-containing protein [Planctomycetota bacterium]